MRPIIYPVFSQRWTPGEFHVVVRYQGAAGLAEPQIAAAVQRADPTSYVEVVALSERIRVQTSIARTQSAAVGLLAVIALLLAAAGIYAMVAQIVEDRRRELGIRSALGATGRSLVALTAASVAAASVLGIAGGAALSLIVARVTRQFLFEMTPFDPAVWSATAAVLFVTAAAAAWWPARRAALVEPADILRGS
jgi:ABC-type antimicrobial peptide transport system permease subunit